MKQIVNGMSNCLRIGREKGLNVLSKQAKYEKTR